MLFAAASGFAQYTYVYVQQPADQLENINLEQALVLRKRAKRLYLRGRDYGLRGLDAAHPGLRAAMALDAQKALRVTTKRDVALLYWTAAAWGAAISNAKDDPDLIADQRMVEALIDRAYELDPNFDNGAIEAFLLTYESARQGVAGDFAERSRQHFKRAVDLSDGHMASPYVAMAETVAIAKQDRAQFEGLLKEALAIDPDSRPEWRLSNIVMQRRARWLLVKRMRVNQIQAALLTTIGMAEIDPSVTALQNMPMVFRSMEEVAYVREKLRPKIEKKLEERGFVVLAWGETGWVRFFSTRPAMHPDEFKKMRIFVTGTDTEQVELMKSIDCHPVPLDWTTVLSSLQTGMIDSVPTAPMVSLGGQYFTVAKYMLEMKWAPLGGGLVITKKAWDGLSPDVQAYLRKSAAEATDEIMRRGRENEEQAIEAMKRRGLVVTTLTPQAEAEWQQLAESMYSRIRGKMVPADLFDEVQSLLAQQRSANPAAKAQVKR